MIREIPVQNFMMLRRGAASPRRTVDGRGASPRGWRSDDGIVEIGGAKEAVEDVVEMPDRLAENLILFIRQNGGRLPRKRRLDEFKALTDDEVALLEKLVGDAFAGLEEAAATDALPQPAKRP